MKKILHIVPYLSRNGIVSFLMNYYREIDRSQILFDFIYASDKDVDSKIIQEIKDMGGRCILIPFLNLRKLLNNYAAVYLFFRDHAHEYEAIHVHQVGLGYTYLFFAWLFRIKYRILHSHSTMYSEKKLHALRNMIYQYPFHFFANRFYACSNIAGEFMFGRNRWKRCGTYIPNAIAPKNFAFSSNVRNSVRNNIFMCSKDCFVVIHVGELWEPKNPKFLLDIFAEIHKKEPNSLFVSCGKITMEREIQKEIDYYNLHKSVLFLGPRSDINQLLSGADIFLLPSFHEGFPVSVVEAQAASLPVILSDRITEQVALRPSTHYLSLKCSPEIWAQKALALRHLARVDQTFAIQKGGCDIHIEAMRLQNLYLTL